MKSQATIALGLIESAFAGRSAPSEMTDSLQLSDSEYPEGISFQGLSWRGVTCAQIQQYSDSVS
jgi:hypothetical protein